MFASVASGHQLGSKKHPHKGRQSKTGHAMTQPGSFKSQSHVVVSQSQGGDPEPRTCEPQTASTASQTVSTTKPR